MSCAQGSVRKSSQYYTTCCIVLYSDTVYTCSLVMVSRKGAHAHQKNHLTRECRHQSGYCHTLYQITLISVQCTTCLCALPCFLKRVCFNLAPIIAMLAPNRGPWKAMCPSNAPPDTQHRIEYSKFSHMRDCKALVIHSVQRKTRNHEDLPRAENTAACSVQSLYLPKHPFPARTCYAYMRHTGSGRLDAHGDREINPTTIRNRSTCS